jgi:nicotinamide riboside kinase
MRNIYIIGAQSTGKTTLVNALESYLNECANTNSGKWPQNPLIIREVARTVLKDKNFSREDITTSPIRALQLQQHILRAQYEAETTACARDASAWYICDRSGLDPIVYAACFIGAEPAAEMLTSKVWLELENRMKEGIVVVCEAGCHWLKDDGVRLMPSNEEEWMRIDHAFRGLLKARGISFSILSKDMEDIKERVEYVQMLIEGAKK